MREFSRCYSSRVALTLVEVMLALVLLASLVVGMITAVGEHHRQVRRAEQRLQAVGAADQLLAGWYKGSQPKVPRLGQGVIRGSGGFRWRTAPIQRTAIETLPVEIVRFEVFSVYQASDDSEPLTQLDLLLPVRENTGLWQSLDLSP